MSDLPPLDQSVRTMLSVNALVAVAILLIVAFSGGGTAEAFGIAALYFTVTGGWILFKAWRAGRARRGQSTSDGSA